MANDLSSAFASQISDYAKEKQAIGFACRETIAMLKRFDGFAAQHNYIHLTKEVFEQWTAKRRHESDKTHAMRFWDLKQFSGYLIRLGYQAYIPPFSIKRKQSRFNPFIFSKTELSSITTYFSAYEFTNYNPTRHIVIPMIFKILICTGMRLNEVLKLKRNDIFIEKVVIFKLTETKYDKDRLIPLSFKMSQIFIEYFEKIKIIKSQSQYAFPSKEGNYYKHGAVYAAFREALFACGISHGGRGKGPRIHDFRHTYSVNVLRKMSALNYDLHAVLPMLSTYLGHKNLQSTQTYLKLTAEVFPDIKRKIEETCGKVIPSLGGHYE